MKKPNNADRLRHILEAVERVGKHLNGYDKQMFEADEKTQDAVVRQMEIIGEAATNLTRDLRSKNPQVEWQIATAMRNRRFTVISMLTQRLFGTQRKTICRR